MAPAVVTAPFGPRCRRGRRRDRGRGTEPALAPLGVPPVDHHLDCAVALEMLLEIARQSLVAARDDEKEAVVHAAVTIARRPRRTALIVASPRMEATPMTARRDV